jgi:competence protein ComGC
MKAFGLIALLAAMAIAAWLMIGAGTNEPTAGTPQNAQNLIQKADQAVEVADLSSLRSVIETYKAAKEGKLPASLEQLKEEGYIDRVPGGVTYDPATGAVSPAP